MVEQTTRSAIMDAIKKRFNIFTLWNKMEPQLNVLCANLPEPVSRESKDALVDGIRKIKQFLTEQGIEPGELGFLEDEIIRFDMTVQLSLYEEGEDDISLELVEKYSRTGLGTEGVVFLHIDLNYEQLKRLTNGVYKKTGLVKFYVSAEKTLYGKIIDEVFEHAQNIPVATLINSKRLDDAGDPVTKKIALFGDMIDKKIFVKVKEIESKFHVYTFVTETNDRYILFSIDKVPLGDYIITGVTTKQLDNKNLTQTMKIPTKLPFLFAGKVQNRIVKFANHGELKTRLASLGIGRSNFFDYPFAITLPKNGQKVVLAHPTWFKKLIWAWLLHAKKGLTNEFPVHILIIGPKGSGKSAQIDCLHAKSKEFEDVWSGRISTLRSLIPSFYTNPGKQGYLAGSYRFAFCDELLAVVDANNITTNDNFGKLNDLLEHKKRGFASGTGNMHNIEMTARVIAAANPPRVCGRTMQGIVRNVDESFLSRWLVYYQKEDGEHVKMVRSTKESDLKPFNFDIEEHEWINILDYLWTFHAKYDDWRLDEILQMSAKVLSPELRTHYESRGRHHIECIMDGIVKTRCMFERDMAFSAKEEDYETLQEIWNNIIRSWIDEGDVRNAPVDQRIWYLPEDMQYLYKFISKRVQILHAPLRDKDLLLAMLDQMTDREFTTAYSALRLYKLVVEKDGFVWPHWFTPSEDSDAALRNYE